MWMPAICPVCHMRYFKRSPDDEICPACRAKKENAQQPKITQNIKPVIVKQNQSSTEPAKKTGVNNTIKNEQKEIKTEPKAIQKVCLTCGKIFFARDNRSKYCSHECRYRHLHKIKTTVYNVQKICPVCGQEFTAKDNRTKYCSAECRYRHLHPYKIKEKPSSKIKKENIEYSRKCAICGTDFTTKYPHKLYCSEICAKAAHKNQKYKDKICVKCGAAFKTCQERTKYCPTCAVEFMQPKEPALNQKQGKYSKVCEWCGQSFRTNYAHTRFCSKKCSKKWHESHDVHAHDIVEERAIPVAFFLCKCCGKQVAVYDTSTDHRTEFCSGICMREYYKRFSFKRERNTANRGLSGGMSLSSLKRREERDLW